MKNAERLEKFNTFLISSSIAHKEIDPKKFRYMTFEIKWHNLNAFMALYHDILSISTKARMGSDQTIDSEGSEGEGGPIGPAR